MRVLLVDDSRSVRLHLGDILRPLLGSGWTVDEAADGAEARAALEAGAVDLVFLDIMLPEGRETSLVLLDRILDADPKARVVILTGLPRKDTLVVEAISHGACAYVRKPVSVEGISTALKKAGTA